MTNPGASAPHSSLAASIGLVDRHLGGHVVAVEQLVERHAQDVALERRDPVERPALRVALDQRVHLLAVALDALDQLAGERRGAAGRAGPGRACP